MERACKILGFVVIVTPSSSWWMFWLSKEHMVIIQHVFDAPFGVHHYIGMIGLQG